MDHDADTAGEVIADEMLLSSLHRRRFLVLWPILIVGAGSFLLPFGLWLAHTIHGVWDHASSLAVLQNLPAAGDEGRGAVVFASHGCASCHGMDACGTHHGPSLRNMAMRSIGRRGELSVLRFVEESILDVDRSRPEPFVAGGMVADYWRLLTPQQIADVAAFVVSLP